MNDIYKLIIKNKNKCFFITAYVLSYFKHNKI